MIRKYTWWNERVFAATLICFLFSYSITSAQENEISPTRLAKGVYVLSTAVGGRTLTEYYKDYGSGKVSYVLVGAADSYDKSSSGFRDRGNAWRYHGEGQGIYLFRDLPDSFRGDYRKNRKICIKDEEIVISSYDTTECQWDIESSDGGKTYTIRSRYNGFLLVGRHLKLTLDESPISSTRGQRWAIGNN